MALEGVHERYVNFYTDFAFKKLFGTEVNKELLRSFLNSLLDGQEVITNLTYLNSEQLGTQELDRKAVFDVYCENDRGEKFLAEYEDSLGHGGRGKEQSPCHRQRNVVGRNVCG